MKDIKKNLEKLTQLKHGARNSEPYTMIENLYNKLILIGIHLYGPSSIMVSEIRKLRGIYKTPRFDTVSLFLKLQGHAQAILESIEEGLICSLRTELKAEVHLNMILQAEAAFQRKNFNVAAVLASAAFEGLTKTKVEELGEKTDDINIQKAINILKSKGVLQKSKSKFMKSFIELRNMAMHGEGDKVDKEMLSSLIAFVKAWTIEPCTSYSEDNSPSQPTPTEPQE
jgi:uncharacterized protein DUF4145